MSRTEQVLSPKDKLGEMLQQMASLEEIGDAASSSFPSSSRLADNSSTTSSMDSHASSAPSVATSTTTASVHSATGGLAVVDYRSPVKPARRRMQDVLTRSERATARVGAFARGRLQMLIESLGRHEEEEEAQQQRQEQGSAARTAAAATALDGRKKMSGDALRHTPAANSHSYETLYQHQQSTLRQRRVDGSSSSSTAVDDSMMAMTDVASRILMRRREMEANAKGAAAQASLQGLIRGLRGSPGAAAAASASSPATSTSPGAGGDALSSPTSGNSTGGFPQAWLRDSDESPYFDADHE